MKLQYKGIDLSKDPKHENTNAYVKEFQEDGFISRKDYEEYDSESKYTDFKFSIELINKLVKEERFSVAIPIICSLIDDRENKLIYYAIKNEKEHFSSDMNLDKMEYFQVSMLSWRIKQNILSIFTTEEFAEEHFRIKSMRGESIHQMVYNLNYKNSHRLYDLYYNHFRKIDSYVQNLKKRFSNE